MGGFVEILRSGRWLTRERIRLCALAMLEASALATLFLAATSDGLNDFQGRPLGTDFANIYAAGTYVIEGQPAAPFDWAAQHARERVIFGADTQFYGWHYPPFFLFVAGLLALMPYALALAVWQGATLILYLLMIRAVRSISWPGSSWPSTSLPPPYQSPQAADGKGESVNVRRKLALGAAEGRTPLAGHGAMWLLVALAYPAVFVNIGHGHNGFLTAALLGGALVALDRRPVLAGILFGLIAYKPQFGLMIPVVLIATARWRAFTAAALTVGILIVVTLAVFGPDMWRAFFASTHLTREVVLESGGTGWHKIQSVFSMVRMWGGGIALAYAVQGTVAIALMAALVFLWRSSAAYPLKAAALTIAAIAVTPYSLDYDLVVLAPAIAFLAANGLARGFAPFEKSALAFLWFLPVVARNVAEHTLVPLGVPLMLIMFALVLRRAAGELGLYSRWQSAVQPMR